ncbi:2-C-methyl-D-erythritol 4-phosphate cytidylyltransferase [Clostridium sp. BJN0001]|uniref:2-C-methyl-D-erythritol 4-phosphate cytidylyltransferase n=1 Tax=Clostridium sp. BJN0001 TaxID=2930219 RepID=UPI001FD20DEA|nr:2-C-methyl-D-erythritol 4-phosphate cytidylyltransferase [Clostridium sp. BJN0001]
MISAVVLAGGKGRRMHSDISKQFILLDDKPILFYTIKKFIDSGIIDKIVVVAAKDELEFCKKEVIEKYNLDVYKVICGGKERQDSVYNALLELKNTDTDIVLIHDGARPFVSERIIENAAAYAKKYKCAAPGVMPKDTIKLIDNSNFSVSTFDRNSLVAVQTPQAFDYNLILKCHTEVNKRGINVTDDTMVAEIFNNDVYIFKGDYKNIKITTDEDLILAKYFIGHSDTVDIKDKRSL